MIIETNRGTIVSDQPNTYLKSETTLGREIDLANWDSKDNYIEITAEEYEAIITEQEAEYEGILAQTGEDENDNNS